MESDVRIQRMQCISDEGILDMDDKIVDVFDEVKDQVRGVVLENCDSCPTNRRSS